MGKGPWNFSGWFILQGEAEEEDENLPVQEVSFDPEKAQCCVVENGQGLTHGSGGKGYGLASTGISSGCYQWKVKTVIIEGKMKWCHLAHLNDIFTPS